MPDDDPPALKATQAVASATSPDVAAISPAPTSPLPLGSARRALTHSRPDRSAARDESSPAETSTRVSVAQYRPTLHRPTLPVSMSGSPVSDVVSVVPEDMLMDKSRFAPLRPQSSTVFTEVVDWGVVESPEFGTVVVPSDMSTITSQFSPLNPRVSRFSTESVDRLAVESPVSDDVPIVELDMIPDVSQFALLNPQGSQVSQLSSVQLSPNRVRLDFDMDTVDVFPVFVASPRSGGYLPPVSPVSSPELPSSRASPAAGSLPDEAAASRDRVIGSLSTSLSITDHRANLRLLTPPLIPLPDTSSC